MAWGESTNRPTGRWICDIEGNKSWQPFDIIEAASEQQARLLFNQKHGRDCDFCTQEMSEGTGCGSGQGWTNT